MDLILLQSFEERINTLKIGVRNDLAEYSRVKNIEIYIGIHAKQIPYRTVRKG
jgi:hypothetical protein